MTIGERIIALIAEKGLSRAEFARLTGIPSSTINDWNRIGNNPASDKVLKICDVLEISPYELLHDSSSNPETPVDYIVVSKGTDKYELLVEYDKLREKQKLRLRGYLTALVEEKE